MFIDSYEDLKAYKQLASNQHIYAVPLLVDTRLHALKNKIVSWYVYIPSLGKEFVFPYKHSESIFTEYSIEDILCAEKCYVYDSMILQYLGYNASNVYDLELAHYLTTSDEIDIEEPIQIYLYRRLYPKLYKTGQLLSLTSFITYAKELVSKASISDFGLEFYDKTLLKTFYKIESSGLCVNKSSFISHYGSPINLIDDKVYTKYHFFTATGRPSNRFGGINFAAMSKNDDTRQCYISRFTSGKLIEIDFKAYHPHIIAWLCGYSFGSEDVYEHLAKYYNNTNTPTKDQITESKEATFNQLYGGIHKKYLHIEFFKKAKEFSTHLYNTFNDSGYIESVVSGRRLYRKNFDEINTAKLFNYYIQMIETELNGLFLQKLFKELDREKALPILYTYDAILFDSKQEYVDQLIQKIIGNISIDFPITVKIGDNYKEMVNYNYEDTITLHIHGH